MSTIKVDEIFGDQPTDAVDLPNKFKVGGASVEQGYTASGSEPSSPSNGDYWWDTGNNKLYRYMDGEFKELGVSVSGASNYGDRAFQIGYQNGSQSDDIAYWNMTSAGNAADFGDLSSGTVYKTGCCSDGTYAFRLGGQNYTGSAYVLDNEIERWATATLGNASDFGDLTSVSMNNHGDTNGSRAVISKGRVGSASSASDQSNYTGQFDYFSTATAGNASDFGDDDIGRDQSTCCANATRMVSMGGYRDPNYLKVMDYITFDTTGNAVSFGDLTQENHIAAGAGTGAGQRGLHMGGVAKPGNTGSSSQVNRIEYIDVDTAGNATDGGDLLNTAGYPAGCSNATVAHCFGGYAGSTSYNVIQQTVLATAANATDFGDLIGNGDISFGASGAAS